MASGATFALVGPPTDLALAEAVGLGGLYLALARESGWRRGLAFGFGANLVALRFVPDVIARFTPLPAAAGWLALLLLAAAQGLPWLVAAVVFGRATRAGLARPAAFAIGVYAACFVPSIFPWTPAAGLSPWPALVQLAEVVGERGVSALVALVVALAVEAARVRSGRAAALAVAAALLIAGYGALRVRRVEATLASAARARVALVQPGFEARERWQESHARALLDGLTALTIAAERRGAELTVWPESAYPYRVAHEARRAPRGRDAILQPGVRGPVLTGLYTTAPGGGSYNSAAVAYPDGALSEPYAKIHLVWFGETVPLADVFPWLRRVFARGLGIVPGEKQVLMTVERATGPPLRMAVLNCFEDTLAGVARAPLRELSPAPNLLVNVTNDAWFFESQESELHARLAALRAVESRRDLVRSVNRGVTSWIDAAGRVRLRYDALIPAAPVAEPALLDGTTPYTATGDVPGLLLVLAALARRRTALRTPQNTKGA
jgi:apolipoprotein N-acyltransferase